MTELYTNDTHGATQHAVSLFKNIQTKHDPYHTTLGAIVNGVRAGRWTEPIERARAALQADIVADRRNAKGALQTPAYNAVKQELPYITPGGVFGVRELAGWQQHTGLKFVDFDPIDKHSTGILERIPEIQTQMRALREYLTALPFVTACWRSVGGIGLHALIRVDSVSADAQGDTHIKQMTTAFATRIADAPGAASLDTAASDAPRAQFVSYDPDAYYNPTAAIFQWQAFLPTQNAQNAPISAQSGARDKFPDIHTIAAYYGASAYGTGRYRMACPAHGGGNETSLVFNTADGIHGGINYQCFSNGCAHNEIKAAIARDMGIEWTPYDKHGVSARAERKAKPLNTPAADGAPAHISLDAVGLAYALKQMGLQWRYNTRSQTPELRRSDWQSSTRWYRQHGVPETQAAYDGWIEVNDNVMDTLRHEILQTFKAERGRAWFGTDNWVSSLNAISVPHSIDPFVQFLDSVDDWDGIERAACIFIDALNAQDTPLNRAAGERFLRGIVHRAYEPGAVHDWIPVLVGAQGGGKSSLCRLLLPETPARKYGWFTDDIDIGASTKERREATKGTVIVEFAEMVNNSDIARVKAFLSRTIDKGREAYGRYSSATPRAWVGVGTANPDGVGVLPDDTTGSRRFVVIECALTEDNAAWVFDYINDNRDQIWAEVVHHYKHNAGVDYTGEHLIPFALRAQQQAINSQHTRKDDIAYDIAAQMQDWVHAGTYTPITLADMLVHFDVHKDLQSANSRVAQRQRTSLKRVLTAAGWTPARKTVDGVRKERWYAPPN